jgi:hypothetical protein
MKLHQGAVAAALAGALVMTACSSDGESTGTQAVPAEATNHTEAEQSHQVAREELRQDMRVLWEDHVAWTRMFIVSAIADLPDTDATAQRLLQNQADIGDAVAEFYGDDAGAQLEALLRDHILIAGDLIAAAKSGDDAAVADRNTAWYANADQIAEFLAGANPAWPAGTLTDMMHAHLDQTLDEATAELTGDYAASVAEYDHIVAHILEMADALAEGIITQFPDRFDV